MWARCVIELDPFTDCAVGMCQALEALDVDALLFQRPDYTLRPLPGRALRSNVPRGMPQHALVHEP